jgi:N-acetylmuramoyl-L-alanine amidase
MKIFVVNFTHKRAATVAISISLAAIIALASVVGLISGMLGDELVDAVMGSSDEGKIVIIDAGHGGEDSGAVGVNGALEKDLNLQIALEVGAAFEEKGYVVVYTRTDDRLLYTEEENIHGIRKISDLKNRCKVAEKYPEAIFVSIHMNSFGMSKYSGLQVYYSKQNEQSLRLAESIQNKVQSTLQKDNSRKVKAGDGMYLLENIANTAVLIECGFLTNEAECKKLSEKEYQKELSFSIVCGIIEYIEQNGK